MKKNPRILVTNDDGIHAHGLQVNEKIAKQLSSDVYVLAPSEEQSCASHSLTINRPLYLKKLGENKYTLNGTPADCTLISSNHVLKEKQPDLILSGVNHGENIGEDIHYSGTVAAALEATIIGIPAIALSQTMDEETETHWETPLKFAPNIIKKLLETGWPKGCLIAINFPNVKPKDVAGVRIVSQGLRSFHDRIMPYKSPRGKNYLWINSTYDPQKTYREGTDLYAHAQNMICITPIRLDRTHYEAMTDLQNAFSDIKF